MFFGKLALLAALLGSCQAAWNVTCDFDLDNIENIVQYLPSECQKIYESSSTSEIYQASLAESSKFQEFYDQLMAFERKEGSTPVGEVPEQNKELRFGIYNTAMLAQCSENVAKGTNSPTEEQKTIEYYNCLLTKREDMINLIPK